MAHVITRMIVGGAQETVLLAAALADRQRFSSVLLSGPQTGPEGSLLAEAERRGVRVVIVPELVREVAPFRDLTALRSLRRVLRAERVELVHTNSSKAGVLGRLAARSLGLPVVHTVHGWPFHEHQQPAAALVWRQIERRLASRTARLVVVAAADRDKGLAAGVGRPEQYTVVRSGLELEQYEASSGQRSAVRVQLGLPLDAVVVGAVNRLSPQKDPLALVRAFAAVVEQVPGAHLVVAGDGPLRKQVDRVVAAAGLSGSVHLLGLRNDVPRLLGAFDVFLSTSLWEGLPRTIVAAMAAGVPVVATGADGVVDIVDDGVTGRLVPPQAPAAAAEAVLQLLADPSSARRMAREAHARVQSFGATAMVRGLEQVYDEVLSR